MKQLRSNAERGEYLPFEGVEEGIKLYHQVSFESYLREIDKIIKSKSSKYVKWSPSLLGKNYRTLMEDSAINGTSGIDLNEAVKVFRLMDEKVQKEGKGVLTHNRSMYVDYADKLPDRNIGGKIRRWAISMHTRNLPKTYDLGVSLPDSALSENNALNPFNFVKKLLNDKKEEIFNDVDPIILSPLFLSNLYPDSISTFRITDEFKYLQSSINRSDGNAIVNDLKQYFKYISEEAPKHYGPWREKVKFYESFYGNKSNIVIIIVGGILAVCLAPGYPIASTAASTLTALFSIALPGFAKKRAEDAIKRICSVAWGVAMSLGR
jgi:hypothetical protein